MLNWTCSITFEHSGYPAGLHLSLRHDGTQGVDETHDSQSGMLQVGRKNVLVQTNTVSRLVHGVARQEWEIIAVTCGEHNGVHLSERRDMWEINVHCV